MRNAVKFEDLRPGEAPPPGVPVAMQPGIFWVRLPLPFQLNHVNVYLIEENDGYAVLDTGIGTREMETVWERLIAAHLDRPLSRLIVTHYHPDHVGAAGWLTRKFDLPLSMSEIEYRTNQAILRDPAMLETGPYRDFYLRRGLDEAATQVMVTRGHAYLKSVSGLPDSFVPLAKGDTLTLGATHYAVETGGGHSFDQVLLHSAERGVFFSADQVLQKISPNVSVSPAQPDSDPLGIYLDSLQALAKIVADDTLVLPGHGIPFRNLAHRAQELGAHHALRCEQIVTACRTAALDIAALVPVLFPRKLDPHQLGFAFGETLAHVNYLIARGAIEAGEDTHGRIVYRTR